jgi:hypothetical protein
MISSPYVVCCVFASAESTGRSSVPCKRSTSFFFILLPYRHPVECKYSSSYRMSIGVRIGFRIDRGDLSSAIVLSAASRVAPSIFQTLTTHFSIAFPYTRRAAVTSRGLIAFLRHPVAMEVIGAGFFDRMHNQTGRAVPSGIELHPVISFRALE